ncbi:MAG TPA: hypothetical protein VIN10_04205 [Bacteroidales bacterium]
MAKKKAFVLRVDPEQIAALERWAQDEFRSINGQIEFLLNDALKKAGRLKNNTNSSSKHSGENTD